jgi:hypothetical protein
MGVEVNESWNSFDKQIRKKKVQDQRCITGVFSSRF